MKEFIKNVKKVESTIKTSNVLNDICVCCGKRIPLLTLNEPVKLFGDRNETICLECFALVERYFREIEKISDIDSYDDVANKIRSIANKNFSKEGVEYINEYLIAKRKNMVVMHKFNNNDYLMTTGYNFETHRIKEYKGVISGQVVLGTGFLSEITATFADFFGAESEEFSNKITKAKDAATKKLISRSLEVGGNAIIGVDFDFVTFKSNIIGVVASGTSVVVEKNEP